jgi:periplasmic copper chaperone A
MAVGAAPCSPARAHDQTSKSKDPMMTSMTRGLACAALASCLLASPSSAENTASKSLVITQPWSRATPGGAKVAGGYLTIENRGPATDRLLSASSAVAKKLEMHEMTVNSGVMTMRPIEGGLAIEPGKAVKLAPGGVHLMFVELKAPLKQGEQIPVTLTFERAGEVKALFEVQAVGATAPAPRHNPEAVKVETAPLASDADESFFTHLHAEKAMANVTVSPDRAGPVEIAIQLENADELPLTAKAVSVTLSNPENGIEPVTMDAEQVGNNQWRVRMSAPVAGRWSLGLGIAITASDKVNVVSPILIR